MSKHRAGGLTFEEIVFACRNFGIDLGCGGCAATFYTGYGAPHDEHCTMPLKALDGTIRVARCTCDDIGEGQPCPRHICFVCRARTQDYGHGLCGVCETNRKEPEKLRAQNAKLEAEIGQTLDRLQAAHEERDALKVVALRMLKSATPNVKEHPTMHAAWRAAEAILGIPRERGHALPYSGEPATHEKGEGSR